MYTAIIFAMAAFTFGLHAFNTLPSRAVDEPGFTYTPSPADWREAPIYQVITDRFHDGDPANNNDNPYGNTDPAGLTSIHGGDFEGLETKLDYIKMLGARAVWISPIVRNANGEFHGFAASDFNAIDPHWGTLQDLRNLVDAAHARGLYVIVDIVTNHGGDLITSDDSGWANFDLNGYNLKWRNNSRKHGAPFNDLSRFYNYGDINNWNDPTQALLGDFVGLDGINTELAQTRQDFITIYSAMIAATDIDGFRIDTARHVEMGFWETFLPAIDSFCTSIGKSNFIVFAEAWLGSDFDLAPYTGSNRFNSALHFPLRDTTEGVFVWGNNTSDLTNRMDNLSLYDPVARDQLVRFLDNHDMPRYLSGDKLSGNQTLLKTALVFHYTSGLVPALYYGTEQGFNGGQDPYDREDMFDGEFEFGPSLGDNFNYTHDLFVFTRQLHKLREAYPRIARGDFTNRWESSGRGAYVYSMTLNGDEAVIAINTSSNAVNAPNSGPGPQTAQSAGTVMQNLFDAADTITVGDGGNPNRIALSLPGYGYKIYVPQTDIVPVAPTITLVTPAHESSDAGRSGPIRVEFDQPMNTATVEAAFSTLPASAGSFVWDAPNAVNYFPSSPLAANTQYTVYMAATAESADGMPLGALFESFFTTGSVINPPNEVPLRQYDLDGAISAVEAGGLRVQENGIPLYADFNGETLYLATTAADNGNDRFIFVTDSLSGTSSAPWAKSGSVDGLQHYLGNEEGNSWSGWFISGGTGGNPQSVAVGGGHLEGTLDPVGVFGQIPQQLYVASVPYGTNNGDSLNSSEQAPSGNSDSDLDAAEYYLLDMMQFDADSDGLADLLEDANRNGDTDAGETFVRVADSDGDGMSDGDEYAAGTDGLDKNSVFASDIEQSTISGQITMRWAGIVGHLYSVQYASGVSGGSPTWLPTAMQDAPGNGTEMTYVESVQPGGNVRMFRVQVTRP